MQDIRGDARQFLRTFSVSYPNVREPGKDTSRRYGAAGIPETYFITRSGKVVAHVIGVLDAAQLRGGVRAAVTGQPTRPGQGGAREGTR